MHTQKLSAAEALKQEGNQLYAKGDVEGAVVSSLPAFPCSILQHRMDWCHSR